MHLAGEEAAGGGECVEVDVGERTRSRGGEIGEEHVGRDEAVGAAGVQYGRNEYLVGAERMMHAPEHIGFGLKHSRQIVAPDRHPVGVLAVEIAVVAAHPSALHGERQRVP